MCELCNTPQHNNEQLHQKPLPLFERLKRKWQEQNAARAANAEQKKNADSSTAGERTATQG